MTEMEKAMRDALVLSLENDGEAENVLRIALPYFEKYYNRAMKDLAFVDQLDAFDSVMREDVEIMRELAKR